MVHEYNAGPVKCAMRHFAKDLGSSKNVDLRYHLVCTQMEEGNIAIPKVFTCNTVAEFMPKPVSATEIQYTIACVNIGNALRVQDDCDSNSIIRVKGGVDYALT